MPPSSFSLVATDLARSFGDHTVLDGVDVRVGPRTRLAVVGPNRVGKSTLLRLLAGLDQPDRGRVTRTPPALRVGYLAQEAERDERETGRASLARRTGVASVGATLDRAAHGLGTGEPGANDSYAAALDAYLAAGGPDFDGRVDAACADLGLEPDALGRATSTLSGGQATRLSLAAVLLSRFDVLLLDEPTNDLDFAGLARLEAFVDRLPGAVVIVSHDRAFLERTIGSVLELDDHTRRGTAYTGGWAAYLEARATARRHADEDYATYEAERARLEERARTQRRWAVQGVRRARRDAGEPDKYVRHFRVATSERLAAKARATERAVERLEPVDKPWQGWDLRMEIAHSPRSGDVVLRLDDAVVELGSFRLGPVTVEIGWQERIAITGPNGAGKTSLLGALLGRLPLVRGARRIGPAVILGELDQARFQLLDHPTLLEGFVGVTALAVSDARSQLAKFGLGAEDVLRSPASLSPGERTRAVLARFAAQGVNCLVLDEPTNHLDLPAIEQLEAALDGYDGTVLVVTHDRRFLDAMRTTRRLTVVDGTVTADVHT